MIVGYGITVEGKIDNCDRLVLDGNMNAELNDLHTLIISESGFFKGKGQVKEAEVSGKFDGELIVDGHITIMETGRIDGKITYESIEIKPGGKFTGEIIQKPEELKVEETPAEEESGTDFQPTDKTEGGDDYIDRALKNRMSPTGSAKEK